MAHCFGRVLIALSLSSIFFASLRFICGTIHAVFGVRSDWIYSIPQWSPAFWAAAQVMILFAWVAFGIGVLRAMPLGAIDPRGELSPLLIAWLPLAMASIFTFGLAYGATDCGSCSCSTHDHTWGDALYVVAASMLPAQRILLVTAILRRLPKPVASLRMRGQEPTSA